MTKRGFGKVLKETYQQMLKFPLDFIFKGWLTLLNILRNSFSIITMALAGYGLFTRDFSFFAYMFLFAGLTMLVLGLQEFKRNKKMWGWLLVGAFIFSIFVATQYFTMY